MLSRPIALSRTLSTLMAPRPRKRSPPASSPSSPRPSPSDSPKRVKRDQWYDWPAPRDQIETAKSFILEAVKDRHRILLCPDKDADGLSSCLVLYRTLIDHLSHPADLVRVYFLPKGVNIHAETAQRDMLAVKFPGGITGPTRAIVLDQGSRPGPALVPPETCRTLIVDHHQSTEFPDRAEVLSACRSEPVATTSILAYTLCCELVPSLVDDRDASMAALLGLYGDLGGQKINLGSDETPWPTALARWEKQLTKTKLAKATALLNAPRRTPEFNAQIAWDALEASRGELDRILRDRQLGDAKERTSNETASWQGAAPKFSKDGKVAVIRVDSGYQIHPVIATRWQGTLRKAKTLVCVMCANTGYTPSKVHFSCRAPRRSSDDPHYAGPPDLISYLKSCVPACEELSPGWGERVGHDFARGHKEATGGIIPTEEFEVLMKALEIGVKADPKTTTSSTTTTSPNKKVGGGGGTIFDPNQKTTLDGFFGIKPKK